MKKTIAILLAAFMLFSLIPVSAFAADAACPGEGEEHTKANCTWTLYKEVPSICGELGYNLYLCTGCGDYFAADFYQIPGNHSYVEVAAYKAPTCTEDGAEAKYACEHCDKVDPTRYGKVIPALGHDWEEVDRTGDCVTAGKVYYECSACDATKEVAHDGTGDGHTYNKYPDAINKEPTCGEDGEATFICTACGYEKDVVIKALGHKWIDDVAVEPTCTETGLTAGKHCEYCGTEDPAQEEIPAKGHDMVESDFVDPTCTEDGSHLETCKVCGHEETVIDPALGHTWTSDNEDGWVVTTESSCTLPGVKQRNCSVCGHNEMDVEDLAPHTYEDEPHIIPPTCTEWGLEVYYCTICSALKPYAEEDKIPPTGHTKYDDPESTNQVYTPETCTSDGLKTWTCGVCGGQDSEVIDEVDGHNIVTVVKAAACHRYAYTYRYCTNDCCTITEFTSEREYEGVAYKTVDENGDPVRLIDIVYGDEKDPDNHDFEITVTNAPTCTEAGTTARYCRYCDANDILFNIPEALGHDFSVDLGETTAATCVASAIHTYKCSRCDETEDRAYGDPLGHDEIDVDAKASTCTAVGWCAHTACSRCDWTEGYEEFAMLPHDYQPVVTAPTCQEDGKIAYTCTVCGAIEKEEVIKYEYDPIYEYESFEDAQLVHPGLDKASETFLREGNCEITALVTYDCAECGKTIHVIADATTGHHNFNDDPDVPAKDPTCTEDGNTAGWTCIVCGEIKKGNETIPATGHDWEDATCTDPKTCSVCGETEGDALGHTWENATCTEAKTCTVCGETEGDALGHAWYTVSSFTATCTTAGFVHHACARCKLESVEYIDTYVKPLGHDFQPIDFKDSTCEEEGHTAGSKCSRCPVYETATEVIPVKDYHWNGTGDYTKGEGVIYDKCTDAEENRYCVWCEETVAKTHTNLFKVTVDSDCNSEGYVLEVCDDCGFERVLNYIPMRTEHLWSNWSVVVEPTYTNTGLKTRYCKCCKAEGIIVVEEEVIPALAGIKLTMDAVNADYPGAAFTDGSIVALTVTFDSVATDVYASMFRVNYSDNLEFIRADFSDENAFADARIAFNNAAEGYVSVTAFSPNDENGNLQNVTISGEMDYVTIYFRVVNGEIEGKTADADFNISNLQVIDTDGDEKTAVAEDYAIVINKYMDATGDGKVDLADILAGNKILTGELIIDEEVVAYDATLDVDNDGEITAFDLYMIIMYINGGLSYEEIINA